MSLRLIFSLTGAPSIKNSWCILKKCQLPMYDNWNAPGEPKKHTKLRPDITHFASSFLVIIVMSCSVCRPRIKESGASFEKSILWWFYGSSLRQCRKLGWAFSKMKYNPSHSKDSTLAGFETQLPRVPHLVEIRGYDTGARWCQVVNLAKWGRREGRGCQVEVLDGRWRWGCCRWGESQVKNLAF